jgi:ribonuclease HI
MNISFGKYKGKSFNEIIINDKQYIKWLVTTDWFKSRDEHNNSYKECLRLLSIEKEKIKKNKTNDILVYTDGACSNNGYINAISGIGVYFSERNNNKYENISKILDVPKPTNNIAELVAILEALKIIQYNDYNNEKIKLYTDSDYCLKTLQTWYKKWIEDGTIDKKQNIDIIKNIYDNYYTKMNIELIYIKAHTKNKDEHSIGNYEADKLATQSIYNFKNK